MLPKIERSVAEAFVFIEGLTWDRASLGFCVEPGKPRKPRWLYSMRQNCLAPVAEIVPDSPDAS